MHRTIIEVDGVNHVPYTVDEIQIFAGSFSVSFPLRSCQLTQLRSPPLQANVIRLLSVST